jgi:putative Holliday junction resolvase
VDWGTRRIGLAVSDPEGRIPRPLTTRFVQSIRDGIREVVAAAHAEAADLVVVGLPLDVRGTEGPSAAQARRLGAVLARKGFAVAFEDERFTTEDAQAWLLERGERRPGPGRLDQVAALLILQAYLDRQGTGASDA